AADIVGFSQIQDRIYWDVPVTDYNLNASTTRVLHTLTVPMGLKILPIHIHSVDSVAISLFASLVTDPDQPDTAPSSTVFTVLTRGDQQGNGVFIQTNTNTSAQIASRQTSASTWDIDGVTFGWIDPRGRNE
ncbi:MAG: hypothetical protein OEN55_15660, partial [Alphaproteobacteria bacterium]|nr:hypothetical protein [Alphaproteobacteria bacterium]